MSDFQTATPDAQVLDLSNVAFAYDDQTTVEMGHLGLRRGESLAVLGPSGCGKTTLLHLLAGLLTPNAGQIRVLGEDITTMPPSKLDRFRGQNIGMVFQRLFLVPGLTVRQNIALAQRLARVERDDARIDELIAQLGLTDRAGSKPRALSRGQAQRVAIARALVHRPALVLADEPTSSLDDHNAEEALGLLQAVTGSAGAGLLIVTHDQRVRGKLDREVDMTDERS